MYRAAWHQGLKTTYYLRTLGASNIEKATISVKKEVRGAVKEGQDGGINSGDTIAGLMAIAVGGDDKPIALSGASAFHRNPESIEGASVVNFERGTGNLEPAKRSFTDAEKTACSIDAMRNGGTCEACQ
jgi:ribonucleoside-diphosphate reductase alpha chain